MTQMLKMVGILLFQLVILFSFSQPAFAAHDPVDLFTADNFAVLAGSAIPDTNPSVITGDVGLSPSTGAGIGLTCAEVTGTIYSVDAAGPLPCRVTDPGLLTIAKNDLTTAYNDAVTRTTTSTIGTALGGVVLTDGTYDSAAGTFAIAAGQTLTLDGGGDADAVFIFKMATTLITASSSNVVLTNGAQACNVFWQVGSSATLGTSTTFVGNIMADQSITDNGGSTVDGRLLARVAAVTLNDTTVTASTCAPEPSPTPTPTPTASPASSSSTSSTSSSGSVSGTSGAADCPALPSTIVSPLIIDSSRVDADSIFISWGPYSGTDNFSVRYGFANGDWLYSTDVTGFSTTINDLPANQPIWVQVAARNGCAVGTYGEAQLVGGPRMPNTGFDPNAAIFSLSFFEHSVLGY